MNLVRQHRGNEPLGRLRSGMDDLLTRVFDDWPWAAETGAGTYWPAVDVSDNDKNVVVTAELPGVQKDGIDIAVLDNVLSISGEKKDSRERTGENYYHVERREGAFRREIRLPGPVNSEMVDATFRDGVLTITLPKDEKALPRRIEVKG